MTFLRITPLLPSFFINFASPIVGVPLQTFFLATAIGLIPVNFLHIKAGETLATMQQMGVDVNSVGMLFALGGLALIPTLFKKKSNQE